MQNKLKQSGADVKWIELENIHLTLKFLGDADDKKLEGIKEILADVASGTRAFQAQINSLGAFPKIDFPRVIWAGLDKGDSETKGIVKALEEKISKLGIPKENKAFQSHITLGRTRSGINKDKLAAALDETNNSITKENLEFIVSKITLFKSTLTPKGALYEILHETNLETI